MQPTDQQSGGEQLLQRYLLGALSEQEQDRVEEEYFTDDDYLDKLLVVENELIDLYLGGKLPAAAQRQFEQNYLTTPEKRQRLQLVKQLRRHANEPAAAPVAPVAERPREQKAAWWQTLRAVVYPRAPRTQYALVFGVLAVLFGGTLLVNQTMRLRTRLGQAAEEQAALRRSEEEVRQQLAEQQRRSEELAKALEQESEQRRLLDEALSRQTEPAPAVVPSFALGFGGDEPPRSAFGPSRGAAKPTSLVIPNEAKLVRLTFKVSKPGHPAYLLAVLGPDGTELWSRAKLSARATRAGQVVTLHVPARVLTRGEYVFVLRGQREDGTIETIREYPVEVERR